MKDFFERILQFANKRKEVIENFSYLSVLQIILLLAPLITYPYLVKVLGMELYGIVVSAQMLMGYAGIVINCGTNEVCAKHVSINRDNPKVLSEIVSSVMIIRGFMAIVCLGVYMLVVYLIPAYREYLLLFLLTYGMLFQDVLFPQYFFQGIEKLKYPTLLSVLIKVIFIGAIFVVIRQKSDYIYVPLLYMLGYSISSAIGLYLVIGKMGVKLIIPTRERIKSYFYDAAPLLATDVVCTIKDKFNYFFIGTSIGMAEVTIYDLGIRLNGLLAKPFIILQTVMFPRLAKSRNFASVVRLIMLCFSISVIMCVVLNIFLPWVVEFFLHQQVDLLPIRVLSLAPVILSISGVLSTSFMVAFGYNKYLFYSIIVTTIVYIACIAYVYLAKTSPGLYTFVFIALISYLTELLYRLFATRRILKQKNNHDIITTVV